MLPKEIIEDPLAKLPHEDKVLFNENFEGDDYLRFQEYLQKNDAKPMHIETGNESETPLGNEVRYGKEIYALNNASLGCICSYYVDEDENRIILTVSGDEEVKEEIESLFE